MKEDEVGRRYIAYMGRWEINMKFQYKTWRDEATWKHNFRVEDSIKMNLGEVEFK